MGPHYDNDPDYENKILDLTSQEYDAEEGPGYICDHREIPMRRAKEDLLSGKKVIVRQGQYYCTCGMIHDPQDQDQRVMQSQEKTGPVIPKPSDDVFFESIPSNAGLTSRKESFDPDPTERERLEAEGCTVMKERITDSSGRTIIKRS